MDNLDRMYRHLVRTIRARFPQYLTQPFDVAELYQTVLPYRLHRRELGLETNDDYEITLSELLAGARDYLIVDDRMRDALRANLTSPNPDPAAFKQFANTSVALSPNALRSLEAGPDEVPRTMAVPAVPEPQPRASAQAAPAPPAPAPAAPAPPAPAPAPAVVPVTAPPAQRPAAPAGDRKIVPAADQRCRACNEVLPAGRPITFCPHCGQNLTTMNCPACGSELELGWRFCPTCGRPASAG
ncbi:MAG TPA: zinc ribbon domain-containing protein [Gemmatimonadaceae bacterium]|nr:zinc ribbon domain-containing protein [Gemmatimonadaceae bacterium]